MRAIARRLQRLEQRFGRTVVETEHTRGLTMRLEEGRRRLGLPSIFLEFPSELRSMSLVEILNSGRRRAALAGECE